MRHYKLITAAVLSALSFTNASYAAEEAESDWTATGNVSFVSDYYFRGISQSWHKPTVQGGLDISHSSGFYAGIWGSGVTPNTYPDANTEIDAYAGYNGTTSIDKLGYTVGLYGYMYPGGSWKKYPGIALDTGKNQGGRWDTLEANFGISYDWISAKLSVTLTDWFGAEAKTGWDGGTKGSTYFEINAAYPLPWYDLTAIGHVGRLNVAGKLDVANFPNASGSISGATNPDMTDYKVGLSKAFKIGKTEGWSAGIYYVGASNSSYWGDRGYGGTSFNGRAESKNLNDGRFVLTLGRTF